MYYPQSQIKTNLFANPGEFVYKETKRPYTGYYWQTSNGKYFTGKNPNEEPTSELIINIDPENTITDSLISTTPVYKNTFGIYDVLKNNSSNTSKGVPISISPQPTQEDYNVGEFQRYFAKKINEVIYIETNKDTYTKLVNKDPELYYEQYVVFDLPWDISGDKDQVYKTNKNIVEQIMVKNRLPKFGDYLKFDYLKYYK